MILNSKQLEELESIHDSVVEFEEDSASTESDTFDEGAESALAWRRSMIEKAASQVKKIHKKAIDPETSHTLGSLLFDRAAKRFGRVNASSPGLLRITYLTGGETQIQENQESIHFGESVSVQSAATVDMPVEKPKTKQVTIEKAAKPETKHVAVESNKKKVVVLRPAKKPTLKTVTKTKKSQKAPKTALKKIAKAKTEKKKAFKTHKPAKKPSKKTGSQKATTYVAYGTISDPVADPNGYIKQYFSLMSNKELANATGLSEHTIRRKLGEWGLKRVK